MAIRHGHHLLAGVVPHRGHGLPAAIPEVARSARAARGRAEGLDDDPHRDGRREGGGGHLPGDREVKVGGRARLVRALPRPLRPAVGLGHRAADLAAARRHERLHVFRPEDLQVHRLQQEPLHDDQQLRQLPLDFPRRDARGPRRPTLAYALELRRHDGRLRPHGLDGLALRDAGGRGRRRGRLGGVQSQRRLGHRHQRLLLRLQFRLRLRPHRLGLLRGDLPSPVPRALLGRDDGGELGGQLPHRAVHAHAPPGHPVQHFLRLRLLLLGWRVALRLAPGDQGRAPGEHPGVVRRQCLVQELGSCAGTAGCRLTGDLEHVALPHGGGCLG
mmetsp:Transcript_103531/g.298172  ORF Transcript_103531/g.298172 Transcript_103531/m.298172 type:complete len:330 (-) Transcript_103531:278-1267(-)